MDRPGTAPGPTIAAGRPLRSTSSQGRFAVHAGLRRQQAPGPGGIASPLLVKPPLSSTSRFTRSAAACRPAWRRRRRRCARQGRAERREVGCDLAIPTPAQARQSHWRPTDLVCPPSPVRGFPRTRSRGSWAAWNWIRVVRGRRRSAASSAICTVSNPEALSRCNRMLRARPSLGRSANHKSSQTNRTNGACYLVIDGRRRRTGHPRRRGPDRHVRRPVRRRPLLAKSMARRRRLRRNAKPLALLPSSIYTGNTGIGSRRWK